MLTQSKSRKVYDNPTAHAYRAFEDRKKTEADRLAPLREKHSRETALQQSQQRRESETLRHNHQKKRDWHSQFPSKPAGLEAEQEKEWQGLIEKHKVQREDLKRRQEAEIAKAKAPRAA
jgi:hypothetical protein